MFRKKKHKKNRFTSLGVHFPIIASGKKKKKMKMSAQEFEALVESIPVYNEVQIISALS